VPVKHLFSSEQLTLWHTTFKYCVNASIQFVSEPDSSVSDEVFFFVL